MGKKLNLSNEEMILHVRKLANIRQKRFYEKHKERLKEKRDLKKNTLNENPVNSNLT